MNHDDMARETDRWINARGGTSTCLCRLGRQAIQGAKFGEFAAMIGCGRLQCRRGSASKGILGALAEQLPVEASEAAHLGEPVLLGYCCDACFRGRGFREFAKDPVEPTSPKKPMNAHARDFLEGAIERSPRYTQS